MHDLDDRRYLEPEEGRTISHCKYCNGEIYEGQEDVVEYYGMWLCDDGCLIDYLRSTGEIRYITASREE